MLTAAIASSVLTSSAQMLAALEQTGLVSSVLQWIIPADRLPDSAEGMPDVVFLDLAREPEPFFAFANQLRRIKPTIKLIACSAAVPPQPSLLLEAMRRGVQDFWGKPVQIDSLKDLLLRITTDLIRSDFPSQVKLIVVMGAKGGVGATTVAVNLGVQLATFARKHTVLFDFARPLGNVHLLLDLHPKFGIRDAVEGLDRLDSHFLAGLLTRHKTKLEILCGTTQPEEWEKIDINLLDRVVNVGQNSFDTVLLDIGSQFSSEWGPMSSEERRVGEEWRSRGSADHLKKKNK